MRYWLVALLTIALVGCGKKDVDKGEPAATAKGPTAETDQKRQGPRRMLLPEPGHGPTAPAAKPASKHTAQHGPSPEMVAATKALRLPNYPNARIASGPDPDKIKRTNSPNGETVQVDFRTPDQAGAVLDFYKRLLAKVDAATENYLAGRTRSGEYVVVNAVADPDRPSQTQLRVMVTHPKKGR